MRVRFFTTRRYSFGSNLFFFLSRTPALPSFFSSRFFSLRYGIPSFRFRRFGLHLPSLFTRGRRINTLLNTYRLGRLSAPISTYGRRTSRVFFFRRRVADTTNRAYKYLELPRTAQRTVFFPNRAVQSTRLWSTS